MQNQAVKTQKRTNLMEIKHIPTIQIKGNYLMIDRRNCGGKCAYKQ